MPRRRDKEIYSYKLKKSGKIRWAFKTYIGLDPETGKAHNVTRQGFKTYKDAEQAKFDLKSQTVDQVVNEQQNTDKRVSEVWDIWKDIYQEEVRGTTYFDTKNRWEKYIKPEFGNSYINKISVDHIQKFANKTAKKYVSYKKIVGLLNRLIKFAIIRGWVEHNPFDRVIMPKKSAKKSRNNDNNFYNRDELIQFLAAAKNTKLKYYLYFMLLANLGLRRGEAIALKWSDFNFKNKAVHIERTATLNKQGKKDIGPVKTEDSDRVLALSDSLVDLLNEYKQTTDLSISDFVFHHPEKDVFYSKGIGGNWMKEVYQANPNIRRITNHGLRHTYATLIYDGSDKITPREVQYALGHSTPELALDIYTHITEKQKENLRKSIDNLDFK